MNGVPLVQIRAWLVVVPRENKQVLGGSAGVTRGAGTRDSHGAMQRDGHTNTDREQKTDRQSERPKYTDMEVDNRPSQIDSLNSDERQGGMQAARQAYNRLTRKQLNRQI